MLPASDAGGGGDAAGVSERPAPRGADHARRAGDDGAGPRDGARGADPPAGGTCAQEAATGVGHASASQSSREIKPLHGHSPRAWRRSRTTVTAAQREGAADRASRAPPSRRAPFATTRIEDDPRRGAGSGAPRHQRSPPNGSRHAGGPLSPRRHRVDPTGRREHGAARARTVRLPVDQDARDRGRAREGPSGAERTHGSRTRRAALRGCRARRRDAKSASAGAAGGRRAIHPRLGSANTGDEDGAGAAHARPRAISVGHGHRTVPRRHPRP